MHQAGGHDAPRWKLLGSRPVYEGSAVRLEVADVETPDGARAERHIVRAGRVAVGVVLDEQERVLLSWRHQLIADAFGWLLPSRAVEPEEHAAATAVRAVGETTGWRPASPMRHMVTFQPMDGMVDAPHEVYLAEGAEPAGQRSDQYRTEWIGLATVPMLVEHGQITDAGTLIGLLYLTAQRAKRA